MNPKSNRKTGWVPKLKSIRRTWQRKAYKFQKDRNISAGRRRARKAIYHAVDNRLRSTTLVPALPQPVQEELLVSGYKIKSGVYGFDTALGPLDTSKTTIYFD